MEYFFVDGMPLGERNPKWLQDDYVKFIRFAQDKMDKVDEGIVGIITNHSFLDNPTFRGMRQSLMNSFDQMYFIDLHGNAKKKEKTPEGGKDENVFDIEQGVAISILIKKKGIEKKIYHADWYGKRKEKYDNGWEEEWKTIKWKEVNPIKPFYLFSFQDSSSRDQYLEFLSVKDIFITSALGFQSHRDDFAIDFNKQIIEKRISDLMLSKDEDIGVKYNLGKWNWQKARVKLLKQENIEQFIELCAYRPFDNRFMFYSDAVMDRIRKELKNNIFKKSNLSLISSRQVSNDYAHTFVTSLVPNDCLISNLTKEANHTFFLYKYEDEKTENFSLKFRQQIHELYKHQYTSEQIFSYIYAILYSPTYRRKYSEFLKMDFPRIPFTPDKKIFEELSDLGWQLIQAHLLKHSDVRNHANVDFKGAGNEIVDKAVWNSGKLFINKIQWFEPVTKEVYEFYIGGYQVLDKYLKDRKGRSIQKEILHVCRVIQSLQFTINQTKLIDTKTSSWI